MEYDIQSLETCIGKPFRLLYLTVYVNQSSKIHKRRELCGVDFFTLYLQHPVVNFI